MTAFLEWSTFAEVLGSAAGALTGLQFVSMALIADMPVQPGQAEAGEAFATPTVVHFATCLFLAAVFSAPWGSALAPAILWGTTGIFGIVYTLSVVRRMRGQSAYRPVLEDWAFHAVLPILAYGTLGASALVLLRNPRHAFFAVAAAALLLLFIGIHNAWDNTTYLVLRKRTQKVQ